MFVIVDRSGRVPCESHRRDPTKDLYCASIACFCWRLNDGSGGILSTGYPDRYGVFVVVEENLVSPACSTNVSANASCDM